MSVTFIPNEEVVAVFCIFWSVSPYIYKKSMEIIVQKRDKTSAVSVIHVYLRSTDLIFLLAKSHFSYSRSMIWQKLFRIFSSMTVNSREKKLHYREIFIRQRFLILYSTASKLENHGKDSLMISLWEKT